MTDKEAMKLALFALDIVKIHYTQNRHVNEAIAALKERLTDPMREVQRLGQEIEQEPVACKALCALCVKRGYAFCANAVKTTLIPSPPQPERHELQAKGEHPAPCARHCEANAFQIVIKNLKAQLAQPEQEPACPKCKAKVLYECVACSSNNYPPPQRTEQNFCSRCGKRTPDLITIHTCTPPKEST